MGVRGIGLTNREEQCLRLVAGGYTTDEIARELRLSSHTINKYVEEAVRKLGGEGRGRRIVAREFVQRYPISPEPLVPEPIGVVQEPANSESSAAAKVDGAEPASNSQPNAGALGAVLRLLPIRRRGGRSIELSIAGVLIWVPILALLITAVIGGALAIIEAVDRLERSGALQTIHPSARPRRHGNGGQR